MEHGNSGDGIGGSGGVGLNNGEEKFSLNSLCDDIYNMFLEVKKKNKKMGLNAFGDKKTLDNRKAVANVLNDHNHNERLSSIGDAALKG